MFEIVEFSFSLTPRCAAVHQFSCLEAFNIGQWQIEVKSQHDRRQHTTARNTDDQVDIPRYACEFTANERVRLRDRAKIHLSPHHSR